ncbi:sugar ABC transporter substrate-binding protein [Shinella sp. 838]|uniref:sugar ABC transporter substrate-binding protein n=1 Tax=Shinella sp. 838 TaxID=3038164 RepID=UPI0024151C3C|nr:sugar ABC transporter substrate-binding protein [Shinella sp. 838]MDG4674913.1 sugar ABC transporter substrate-binding protein [Shinella sp. 838]
MKTSKTFLATATALALALPCSALADSYGYSSNGLSFPFAAAVAKGFADAAKAEGDEAIVLDSKSDVLKQTNDIDDLIAQGVKGIAIMPNDSAVATAWVDKVTAAGIPVVASASMIGDTKTRAIDDVYDKLSALVTQQEVAAGVEVGNLSAQILKDAGVAKAKIAIIEGAAGYAEVKQRTEGFEKGMKDAGQDYEIVAAQPGDWTAEKGEAACQNILASNPDVDLFFNQADDMVVGCARAVEAAGAKAKLVGFGGSKLAIQAIKDGKVTGTVCYKPEEIGKISYEVLKDVVSAKKEHNKEFITYPTPGVSMANIDDCVGQW